MGAGEGTRFALKKPLKGLSSENTPSGFRSSGLGGGDPVELQLQAGGLAGVAADAFLGGLRIRHNRFLEKAN
jgi:hypothetical protein